MSVYLGCIDKYKDRDTYYHAWLHYPCAELISGKRFKQAMTRWLKTRGFQEGNTNGYF